MQHDAARQATSDMPCSNWCSSVVTRQACPSSPRRAANHPPDTQLMPASRVNQDERLAEVVHTLQLGHLLSKGHIHNQVALRRGDGSVG